MGRWFEAGRLLTLPLAAVAACAQLEGLDGFRKVDGLADDGGGADAAPGSSLPAPALGPPYGMPTGIDASIADSSRTDDGGPYIPPLEGGKDPPLGYGPNLVALGVASATSEYQGYPAAQVIDGVLTTSWYAAAGSCPAGAGGEGYTCNLNGTSSATWVEVTLAAPSAVGRVRLFGNRDTVTGYDVLAAEIQLLDGKGQTLYSTDVLTGRGAEPNGDIDQVVPPTLAVSIVRVAVVLSEGPTPGISEIEVYGQ